MAIHQHKEIDEQNQLSGVFNLKLLLWYFHSNNNGSCVGTQFASGVKSYLPNNYVQLDVQKESKTSQVQSVVSKR